MKTSILTSLLLTILFALPFGSISQDDIVDEGLSPIYVNAPLEGLTDDLTKVEPSELWFIDFQDPENKWNLDAYTYDVKALKTNLFFGLPVERIEVKSNWCYDESAEDEEEGEFIGIREFYMFIKLPSEKEFNAFSSKVEEKYGPIRSYEIDMEDDSETPLWFSFMTMLTFTNYDTPFVAADGEKYILVKYRCGHGG